MRVIRKGVYNLGEAGKTLEKGIQEKLKSGILTKEAAYAFLGRKGPSSQGPSGRKDADTNRFANQAEILVFLFMKA